jgi:hypothetical protein
MKEFVVIAVSIVLTLCTYMLFRSFGELKSINDRLDRANVEYQFVVTDSTITVWDNNRLVGNVKLEGQLDSLIMADNE